MMVTKELEKLRGNLDQIDRRLVEILDERLKAVAGIARLKAEGLPFLRDHERESELLGRVEGWARELGIDEFRTQEIFRELIAMSLKAQEEALLKRDRAQQSVESAHRVAFQGVEGSYSHIAARKYFAAQASKIEFVGFPTFAAALEEAETGGTGYAFLPTPPVPSMRPTICCGAPSSRSSARKSSRSGTASPPTRASRLMPCRRSSLTRRRCSSAQYSCGRSTASRPSLSRTPPRRPVRSVRPATSPRLRSPARRRPSSRASK